HYFNSSSLFKTLDFEITSYQDDCLKLQMNHNNELHSGSFGKHTSIGANGLIVTAGLEAAIGVLGVLNYNGQSAGVIEISVKLVKVIRGKLSTIQAKVDRTTNDLTFISATLYDERGGECAYASGIVSKI
ncbi:hypothetical protein L8S13_25330, partial [Vibrio lentus]|uniref:PaaI family thioesterase n=1 Tax=Vibrio lentus TaxID=136468 RepID=UPI002469BD9E